MPREVGANHQMSPRVRRTLELVYGVEGVVAATVWQWGTRFAVGVRAGSAIVPAHLLQRVESAISGLREPGETWEFGLLADAPN